MTYRSICALEAIELLLRLWELFLRHLRLQHLGDVVPEGLVVFVEQHDEAGGLRVEAGGDVEDGLLRDLGDLLVGDGRLLIELVVRAAVLDRLEEGLLTGHVVGGGGGEG